MTGPEMTGADPSVSGSPTNPSPPFPQVNPSVSVEGDGLTPDLTPPTSEQSFSTNPDFNKKFGALGLLGPQWAPTRHPVRLVYALGPRWAARWQAKIDNEDRPDEQADHAWRALRSAVRTHRLSTEAQTRLFAEVRDFLIESANAATAGRRQPRRPHQPNGDPAGAAELHATLARRLGWLTTDAQRVVQGLAAGHPDAQLEADLWVGAAQEARDALAELEEEQTR